MIRAVFFKSATRDLVSLFRDPPVRVGLVLTETVWQAAVDDQDSLFFRISAHPAYLGTGYINLRGRTWESQVFEAEWQETILGRAIRRRGKMADRPIDKPALAEFIPPHHFFGVDD